MMDEVASWRRWLPGVSGAAAPSELPAATSTATARWGKVLGGIKCSRGWGVGRFTSLSYQLCLLPQARLVAAETFPLKVFGPADPDGLPCSTRGSVVLVHCCVFSVGLSVARPRWFLGDYLHYGVEAQAHFISIETESAFTYTFRLPPSLRTGVYKNLSWTREY